MRLLCLFILLGLAPQGSPSHASDCFEEAGARRKVSARVLRAIAKLESDGFHNIPEPDHEGHKHQKSYGVMGLRDDEVFGHSLRDAALASGHPVEEVIKNPCVNIDAAAALLAAELSRNGGDLKAAAKRYWGLSALADEESYRAFEREIQFYSHERLPIRMAPGTEPPLSKSEKSSFLSGLCWNLWSGCGHTAGVTVVPKGSGGHSGGVTEIPKSKGRPLNWRPGEESEEEEGEESEVEDEGEEESGEEEEEAPPPRQRRPGRNPPPQEEEDTGPDWEPGGEEEESPTPRRPKRPDRQRPPPQEREEEEEREERPMPRGNGSRYPGADWAPSPNFGRGGFRQAYIILHTTEGAFSGSVRWLSTPSSKVSAHYVVRKSDGYVKQLVKETDRAYHARCWNSLGFAIEMEGFHNDPGTFTRPLMKTVTGIVRYLSQKYGIAPNATRIVGHDAKIRGMLGSSGLGGCNDHRDPGPHFDWSNFWRLIR
jgi:hypothetical protein